MSLESAKAFLERMKTDEDFSRKVSECKDAELRKELIGTEGFDFTMDDLKICGMNLSEDELEPVTGGAGNSCLFHVGIQFYG